MMTIQIYVTNNETKKVSLVDFHFDPKQFLGFWINTVAGKATGDIIFYLPGQTLATPFNTEKVASFIEILNINADKK